MGLTQPRVQWVPGFCAEGKPVFASFWPLTST